MIVFKELFDEIEQLVPGTECTPAVLLTSRNHNGRYVNDLEAFMEYIHKEEMNNRSKNPERTPGWLRKIKEICQKYPQGKRRQKTLTKSSKSPAGLRKAISSGGDLLVSGGVQAPPDKLRSSYWL